MDRLILSARNASATPLVSGEVVRVTANHAATRALADASANVQGTIGVANLSLPVAAGREFKAVVAGFARAVLLELGLAPAAGQSLFVSPTVAGRATNIAPAIGGPIAVIFDTSTYALNQCVQAVVMAPSSSAGASAALQESLTNGSGAPSVVGNAAKLSAASAISTASLPAPIVPGVGQSPQLAPALFTGAETIVAAAGAVLPVETHGKALLRAVGSPAFVFDDGVLKGAGRYPDTGALIPAPSPGQVAYLVGSGVVADAPVFGDWIVPVGTFKDFVGGAGNLSVVDLWGEGGNRGTMTYEWSFKADTLNANDIVPIGFFRAPPTAPGDGFVLQFDTRIVGAHKCMPDGLGAGVPGTVIASVQAVAIARDGVGSVATLLTTPDFGFSTLWPPGAAGLIVSGIEDPVNGVQFGLGVQTAVQGHAQWAGTTRMLVRRWPTDGVLDAGVCQPV